MEEIKVTTGPTFKFPQENNVVINKEGWLIPEGLDRMEKIEWEIDNRLNGGKAQLDLTLSKLFDISNKNKNTTPKSGIVYKEHPNNNIEPAR